MKHNGSWCTDIKERDGNCIVSVDCRRFVRGRKFWVAKITGKDKKFGLSREFQNGTNYGTKVLTEGIYDVYNCPRTGAADYERFFLQVYPTGEAREITMGDVLKYVDAPAGRETTPVLTECIPF